MPTTVKYNAADPWHNHALHESAHVVAALAGGYTVTHVTLLTEQVTSLPEDGPDTARLQIGGEMGWHSWEATPRDQVRVLLAGYAARSLVDLNPRFDRFNLELFERDQAKDFRDIAAVLDALRMDTEERRRLIARSWSATRQILQNRWLHVTALATELLYLHQQHRLQQTTKRIVTTIAGPDPVLIARRRARSA